MKALEQQQEVWNLGEHLFQSINCLEIRLKNGYGTRF